jgi:plastocyanin
MRADDRCARISAGWAGLVAAGALLGVVLGATPGTAATGASPSAAGGTQPAAVAPGPRIEIKNHAFSLPTVTVPVGGTVTWVNHDDDVHTVVSTTAVFQSSGLDTDESYSYRFAQLGTYRYFCTLHPLMVGTVIVE